MLMRTEAWLPSDFEFGCFWNSVLLRMTSSAAEQDWRESEFAQYLRHHVLDVAVDGTIRPPWQSGFGCVPPGLTTYAPNSLERSWRSLKGLLRKGILGISGDFLNVCLLWEQWRLTDVHYLFIYLTNYPAIYLPN